MAYRLLDGPVREAGGVTEVAEVVDVTEEFVLQLWVVDDRYGAVLVESPRVGLEPRSEVSQVRRDLLDHHTPRQNR